MNYRHRTDQQWRELAKGGCEEELGLREDAPEWFRQEYGSEEE